MALSRYKKKKERKVAALASLDLQSVRMDYMCCERAVQQLKELLSKREKTCSVPRLGCNLCCVLFQPSRIR